MNSAKTFKALASLTLSIGTCLAVLTPQKGEAFLLTDANLRNFVVKAGPSFDNQDFWGAQIICLVILPFCLFDGKASPKSQTVSRADLAQQGYAPVEISAILRDQTQFTLRLRKLNLKAKLQKGETYASLSRGIRNLYPQVSPTYLQFFADQTGIRRE